MEQEFGDVLIEDLEQTTNLEIISHKFTNDNKQKVIFKLIQSVKKGEITINEIIADEMKTFEYQSTNTGKLTFNARSGFHDDSISAIALANFYFENYSGNIQNWKVYSA